MDYIEINDQLKTMINDLVTLGYKKTIIGKLLLGASGYAPILKAIDSEDNTPIKFGVKPLSRVASVIDCELKLVFVKKDNTSIINEIHNLNSEFFASLQQSLIDYMNTEDIQRKPYTISKKRKNEFESVLDEIFSTKILEEPPENMIINSLSEESDDEFNIGDIDPDMLDDEF